MMGVNLFAGLPDEFSPPEKAAARIAALDHGAEREALFLRVPEGWRPMVGEFTKLAIGARIFEMESKLERQNALAAVPDLWREDVKWMVLRMWRRRELLQAEERRSVGALQVGG